jgi:hypothetical protein
MCWSLLLTTSPSRISPAVTLFQPGHGAQQRGLAAARRADQHADVAGAQAKRHVLHRGAAAAPGYCTCSWERLRET